MPAGTVAVINCSGKSIVDPSNRWTEKFKQELYDSRMETTLTLAKAIIDAPEKPACFLNVTGNLFYPMDSEAGEGHQGWAEDSPGGNNWIARLDHLSPLVIPGFSFQLQDKTHFAFFI